MKGQRADDDLKGPGCILAAAVLIALAWLCAEGITFLWEVLLPSLMWIK